MYREIGRLAESFAECLKVKSAPLAGISGYAQYLPSNFVVYVPYPYANGILALG